MDSNDEATLDELREYEPVEDERELTDDEQEFLDDLDLARDRDLTIEERYRLEELHQDIIGG